MHEASHITGKASIGEAVVQETGAFEVAYAQATRPWSNGVSTAHLRIMLCYIYRHGRLPDLTDPRAFTELVQVAKLADRSPGQAALLDKLHAKAIVRATLGKAWVTPTLWSGARLPPEPPFPCPAILKARHGCNQYQVMRAAPRPARWRALQRRSARWMARAYGGWLDEWAYTQVPRGLLAEPLHNAGGQLPIDYKIYVFDGQATHVQVHLGRATKHRWILHDRNWRQLVAMPDTPAAPASLAAMLNAAETLAAGRAFLRVDFYEVERRPLFGEFCLYPGSGLDRFAAPWIDLELGRLWRAAQVKASGPVIALPDAPR